MPTSPPAPEMATALVETRKRYWREGAEPDAAAALRENPELLAERSLVVDLAYEEYCLREEAGEVPDAESFCRRFPAYRSQIREVIRGHRLLADHPELLTQPVVWPRPGDTFEQLVVVRELGRGAFARAYLARDPETGDRPVVLKLSPARSEEARTLGTIAHENIATVFWARQAGGFFAVCMPFVGARTLRDAIEAAFASGPPRSGLALLGPGPVPDSPAAGAPGAPLLSGRESYPDAVAAVAACLADAVAYLHGRGIAHGDLKPSNVLLGPGGRPHLIDFNLSTGDDASLLRLGGTLPYMAPEQLRLVLGKRGAAPVPAAGDVHAFGVVLFEALTGRVPFEPVASANPSVVASGLLARRAELRRPPTANSPGIPAPLTRLIDACLAENSLARPPIGLVKRSLLSYLARHRNRRLRVAGLAPLALAATGWALAPAPHPPVEPPPTVVRAVEATPQTAEEFFARALRYLDAGDTSPALRDLALSYKLKPDGRTAGYLAYAHSLAEQYPSAAFFYKRASRELGFSPAWVRCNLAHTLIRFGQADDCKEALVEAEAALATDPNLRPARLNRADALFRLNLNNTEPSPTALADIEAALSRPPHTLKLYLHAADIVVRFGADREEYLSLAVGYLARAVELGHNPALLKKSGLGKSLGGRRDFEGVLAMPRGTPAPQTTPSPYLAVPPLR